MHSGPQRSPITPLSSNLCCWTGFSSSHHLLPTHSLIPLNINSSCVDSLLFSFWDEREKGWPGMGRGVGSSRECKYLRGGTGVLFFTGGLWLCSMSGRQHHNQPGAGFPRLSTPLHTGKTGPRRTRFPRLVGCVQLVFESDDIQEQGCFRLWCEERGLD